jgi:hypothetical protein
MHRRLISCAVVVVALMSWSTAAASAHPGDRANDAAVSVTRVAPPVQGEVQARAIRTRDGSYAAASSHTTTSAPANSRGKFSFTSTQSAKTLTIGLPTEVAQADAVLSSDGSVVYGSDSDTSSIVVQSFTNGVRMSTTLASKEAGTSFSYPLDLAKGSRIEVQDNGGVLIVGPDGSFLGGLLTPWAKDRNGATVPTHYTVHGNSVVQVIDSNSAALAYPVVADPFLFIDLIDSWQWQTNAGLGLSDHVHPTAWATANCCGWAVAEYGWEELVHKDTGHKYYLGAGMHDQYDCHQMVALIVWITGHATYDLDTYRPHTSLADTIAHGCNPPIGGGGGF